MSTVITRLTLLVAVVLVVTGCRAAPEPEAQPTCFDVIQNGDESDVDCGGPDCAACPIDAACTEDTDCASDLCTAGQCSCEPGYTASGISVCLDIDECAEALDDCDPTATCTNTDGGFSCSCPDGSRMVDGACVTCDPGTWGPDCAETCAMGDCAADPGCDPATGEALTCGSCEVGSWGALCDQSCDPGDCTGTVTCDANDGAVLACEGGCAPGTFGQTCELTCEFEDCVACDDSAPCAAGSTCIEGFCLQDLGTDCEVDRACGDVCVDGTCAEPSPTGGACETASDCIDPDGHECVFGTCLLTLGGACDTNEQCLDTCIDGRCSWPALTGNTCDEDADCETDHRCADGVCMVVDGGPCDANAQCENTCVEGTCTTVSDLYGLCDDTSDCLDGMACEGDTCLLRTGTTCSADFECEDTCIRGVCSDKSSTRGTCDNYVDCTQLHDCVEGECLLQNDAPCDSNNDCVNVCVLGACNPVRDLGETCDETADCAAGTVCMEGVCLYDAGQVCAVNDECAEVCIHEVCQDRSDTGGQCDETPDCVDGHQCIGGTCLAEDDELCDINGDCINVCLIEACGPQSDLDGVCDEDEDCTDGHICTDAGTCKRAEGAECSTDLDCASINTHCIGGSCLTDIDPDPITFADRACINPGTPVTSNTVQLGGFYGPLELSLDGDADMLLNSVPTDLNPVTVTAGDTLALQMDAPAGQQATVSATATLGDRQASWNVSTAPNINPGTQVHTETNVLIGGSRSANGNSLSVPFDGRYTVATSMRCRDRIHDGDYHYTWCTAYFQRLEPNGSWTSLAGHAHHNGQCCTGQSYVQNRSTTLSLEASQTYRFTYRASPRISGSTTVYNSGATVSFQQCE